MSRQLPPLNSLRAFEAAARHLSFAKAAEELHVTPAAISQQVKGLEAFYGVKLFRRMTRALILSALLALSACDEATQAVDDVARRGAKSAVVETLTTRFPAVPKAAVTPFTDCLIDNASAREIGEFAKDAVIGVSDSTVALVTTVLQRPETQTCVAQAGLSLLTA